MYEHASDGLILSPVSFDTVNCFLLSFLICKKRAKQYLPYEQCLTHYLLWTRSVLVIVSHSPHLPLNLSSTDSEIKGLLLERE